MKIHYKFVEFIPERLDKNTLYISIEYCTATHLCMCGCGNKVVTPLSVTDWEITFNGESVSLYPSIGNWSFECRSHYWIEHSEIYWARVWSEYEIRQERINDLNRKSRRLNEIRTSVIAKNKDSGKQRVSIGVWLKKFIKRF